jgi:hypothetical protein
MRCVGDIHRGQQEKIYKDEIMGSSTKLIEVVAADGKQREMFCIPLEYGL